MLFIGPSVDGPIKLDMRGANGPTADTMSVVRFTEGSGHVVFDGTAIIDVASYA